MKVFYICILVCAFSLCGTSCAGSDKSRTASEELTETVTVEHYFDRFEAVRVDVDRDSAMIADLTDGFIAMLMEAGDTLTIARAVSNLWARVADAPQVREAMLGHMRMRLFDNGPHLIQKELFRELLLPLAADSAYMASGGGERVDYYLSVVNKNRAGHPAEPFKVRTHAGGVVNLYDVAAPQLLVYFFDPECHNCREVTELLVSDPTLAEAVRAGRVRVLAVYTEDDSRVWDEKCRDFPTEWIVGRDISNIVDNELYDLRAMPTLYLLDEQKRVIATDDDALGRF